MFREWKLLADFFLHILLPGAIHVLPPSTSYLALQRIGMYILGLIKICQAIIILRAKDMIFPSANWLACFI